VDDEIDLATQGGGQCGASVGEEVGAAPPAIDPGPQRMVETEVGIGQQKNAESQRFGCGQSALEIMKASRAPRNVASTPA